MNEKLENTVCDCGNEKAWDEVLCPDCQEKDKVVVVKQENAVATPSALIKIALESGAEIEKLEKLLTLQEKWEANEAKKAYHVAMAGFKANPLKISKDKAVSYKPKEKAEVKYAHASLANVVSAITLELSKHGLSASWKTQQNGQIIVTCMITHIKGHTEETTLSAPADVSGSKNAIQAIGSTITYLERYTLLSALGLATYDQDDDGKASEVEFIEDKQLHIIRDNLIDLEANETKFCEFLGVDKLENLPKSSLKKAMAAIEATRKKREAKS